MSLEDLLIKAQKERKAHKARRRRTADETLPPPERPESLLASSPQPSSRSPRRAGTQHATTDYGEIDEDEITLVRAQLEEDGDNPELVEYLGFLLYASGKYEDATLIYLGLLDDGHDSAVHSYRLGNCYFRMGNLEDAERFWRKALESSPTVRVADIIHRRLAELEDQSEDESADED